MSWFSSMRRIPSNQSRSLFELAVVILFILLIWFRAFSPVPVGLPDNGDFPKVLGRINAWPPGSAADEKFDYLVTGYVLDPNRYWDSHLPTLEVPLARLAKAIGSLLLPPGRFDLRFLGALHALILVAAVWLILRGFRSFGWLPSFALAVVTVAVFADLEYLQFLNSAFMDAGAMTLLVLLFALGTIVTRALPAVRWGWIVAFVLTAAAFVSTKTQVQFSAVPLALFCFYFGRQATDRKAGLAWFSGIVLVLGAGLRMSREMPPDYPAPSAFSLTFLKLLPLSASPQETLAELGRPPSDIRYIGMHPWSPGSPMEDRRYYDNFWRQFSSWKVLKFYGKHPRIALTILWRDLLKSGSDIPVSELPVGLEPKTIRVYGAFRKSDNPQPHARPRMLDLWSDFRRFLARRIPFLIPALYGVCAVVGLYQICRSPASASARRWALLLLMISIGIFCYLVSTLADALDTSRHIAVYQVATDLMILFLLCLIPREITT